LESLQSLYVNHHLIIFSDSRHFFSPITGKLYSWLSQFHAWKQPFLFTSEAPDHWDYYKQQLHKAGLVVLATGQQGLEELVSHISADVVTSAGQRGKSFDLYPAMLEQRPRRFLERHAPAPEMEAELLTQLLNFLKPDGFKWLAACAVYPGLNWNLTLSLGQQLDLIGDNNTRLLRLARLPWFRYGYMPDWLRIALLEALKSGETQAEPEIRDCLNKLLSEITKQAPSAASGLKIAQNRPFRDYLHRFFMPPWKKTDDDNPLQEFVFQSFMDGKLAVKASKLSALKSSRLVNRYTLVIGIILLTCYLWNKLEEQESQVQQEKDIAAKKVQDTIDQEKAFSAKKVQDTIDQEKEKAAQNKYPKSAEPNVAKLTIGSPGPGGGIVFYVDNIGKHGLEAKGKDEPKEMDWDAANKAAKGYGSGWHLPSKDELNKLYKQKDVVGGFAYNNYWSSTDYDNYYACYQYFDNGSLYTYPKLQRFGVRAVRAF
jgi:hypothetical protein